ncbi:unnamed protein product [Pieris brassicae]|uniref:PiggyBac transposable element-derived protein domain-containing protein n=1 Tax=Pieris brassicae TaxID=7116 RepID=A0A9P0TT97_PIEBR|nr:unnamed protein product [Pieris brassicae]
MDDFMADVGEAVQDETYNVESMRQIVNELRSEIIQVEEIQGNLGGGDGGSKWYHKVFRRLLNFSILNAFLIYRRNPTFKVMTQRVSGEISKGLLDKYQVSAPSVSTLPGREVRLDQKNHFPIQVPADQNKRVHTPPLCALRSSKTQERKFSEVLELQCFSLFRGLLEFRLSYSSQSCTFLIFGYD